MPPQFQCPTCGQDTYNDFTKEPDLECNPTTKIRPVRSTNPHCMAFTSPPEKKESKTKILNLPVRIAQIKLRDDNGPTDNLSSPERFLQIGDKFYDLKHIQSVPAFHVGQLEFCDE